MEQSWRASAQLFLRAIDAVLFLRCVVWRVAVGGKEWLDARMVASYGVFCRLFEDLGVLVVVW